MLDKWVKRYLSNRTQFLQVDEKEITFLETINCGVPQGPVLGPFLFLLYVSNFKNDSNILDPIMFADDTNLFLFAQELFISNSKPRPRKHQPMVYFK